MDAQDFLFIKKKNNNNHDVQSRFCPASVEKSNWWRKVKWLAKRSLITVSREADTFDRLFLVSLKVKPRDESRQTEEETGKQTLFSENAPVPFINMTSVCPISSDICGPDRARERCPSYRLLILTVNFSANPKSIFTRGKLRSVPVSSSHSLGRALEIRSPQN